MPHALPHMDYEYVRKKMQRSPTGHPKLAHNTYAHCAAQPPEWKLYYSIRLHGNEIVRLYEDGQLTVTDAGWPTQTTVRRLNAFVPVGHRVYIRKGHTIIQSPEGETFPL